MFQNTFCVCESCEDNLFPTLEAGLDCNNNIFSSEICGVVILPSDATPPTDWTTLAGWSAVIDNSDTTNSKAKYFLGIGNVPVPEKSTVESAKGYKRITDKRYQLNMDIVTMDDSMFDFLKYFQCNPKDYTFYLHVTSGHLLGTDEGIYPNFTTADFPFERGEDAIQKGLLTIEWQSLCDPERAYIDDFISVVQNNTAPDVFGAAVDEVWGSSPDQVFGL